MRTRLAAALGALAAAALLTPAAALAHGTVGRQDLPIPRWLFAWAAAVVLVVSFVGLAVLWSRPKLEELHERRLAPVPRVLEPLGGALGLALFVFLAYAGLSGSQTPDANILPTFVFNTFWVGIPIVTLLLGDVFRWLNPWRALARGVGWVAGRVGGRDALPEPLAYPERLGRWPAALGILVFAWIELAYADRDDPSTLAALMLAYAAVQLVGMAVYGVERWTERADPFAVYFGLFARISPLRWRDGAVWGRTPLAGLTSLTPVAGTVALLCVMIGTTSFDGLSQGTLWNDVAPDLQSAFGDLGLSLERSLEAAFTVGLLVMVLLVAGLYALGVAGMRTVRTKRQLPPLSGAFVHSLIPIALAYVIAHYFSYFANEGQRLIYLASDPLGDGSDLLGTASVGVNYWLQSNGVWYVQVFALIAGHVAGLALAHDRALALYRDGRAATRSQYWMLAVMVAFTSLGLWLLSAAAQ